jgi:allantoinase
MSQLDIIIRGGTVVTHESESVADIGIADGKIAQLASAIDDSGHEIIDANGLHIFPGLIDSHVHFNDPGRAHWEGIETGSHALAAGGGTMFFDMPLNSSPPTLDGKSFDLKRAVAEKTSLTDFALWGGLTPQNLDKLEELAERGVVGFKAFMSNSGIEDFPRADDATLREGMKRAAKLGKLVAVHAEDEEEINESVTQAISENKTSIRDYLDSRSVRTEVLAINRAINTAADTNCALHIVHVSCGYGVGYVNASVRKRDVDVTCETCPHYLTLTEKDMETLGAAAKCAPPFRKTGEQEMLWSRLLTGQVCTVGSDHSPSPPEMKTDKNFFNVWGGISGVQHTLPLLLTEGHKNRGMPLHQIARLTSLNVAERFNLPKTKGRIAVGADADLALVDLNAQFTVRAEDLFYRHRHSPYVGRTLTGRLVRTILRGTTIFQDGKIVSPPIGKFVKPTRR